MSARNLYTPDEGWRARGTKRYDNKNRDEENRMYVNDDKSPSHKFREIFLIVNNKHTVHIIFIKRGLRSYQVETPIVVQS